MEVMNERYLNRELSWAEFNQRVLDEARNPDVPLLERLKFLAITSSNLDEFFMVRVGGLQVLEASESTRPDPSGMTPKQQLSAIRERLLEFVAHQSNCLLHEIEPELRTHRIRRLTIAELSDTQREWMRSVFDEQIFPVLSPIAIEEGEPFPLLSGLTLSAVVRLKMAAERLLANPANEELPPFRFAIIPFGRVLNRIMTLPSDNAYDYILLEDMVEYFVGRFFPEQEVVDYATFRITRNADMGIREDQAFDLLNDMVEMLGARKESDCVRLELASRATAETRDFLSRKLDVDSNQVYSLDSPLDLSVLMALTDIGGFEELKYEKWEPQASPVFDPAQSVFDNILANDLMLYHPYESFDPVVRFISEAADDPNVLAIKQSLYRTSRNSPIIAALQRAAQKGKHVTAIVELKARFDEKRNIEWARQLEQAGANVLYGVKGLKTHAKICMVTRREPHGIRRYCHFGTGNYNETTARVYSDVSLLTCDEELGADATAFFNAVTGYSQPTKFRKLEAAPIGMKERLIEMIDVETQQSRDGRRGHIAVKLNALVDSEIIDRLYAASQSGVIIKLNVRGICCLRPGVPGLSENIEVVSVVDRYLEHARIAYFFHGGDERVFISSADWMPRNLNRRVELLVPVEERSLKIRLINVLDVYFRDNVKARRLNSDGTYIPVRKPGAAPFRCQYELYKQACQAKQAAERAARTILEPHRSPASQL
jgi:polyphosphate kinase